MLLPRMAEIYIKIFEFVRLVWRNIGGGATGAFIIC